MTVIRHIEPDYGSMKGYQDNILHKHWGSSHVVKVFREPQKSLGISIVGGKVDVQPSERQSEAFLGIFVKSVAPESPAGKTGQFKTGDRILEVSGIDLREATHDKAVEAIKNATNPVVFLVQSLIPWGNTENDNNVTNENECHSPFSSLTNQNSLSNQKHLENHDNNDNIKFSNDNENNQPATKSTSILIQSNSIVESENEQSIPELKNHISKRPTVSDESGSDDDELDTGELEGRTVSSKGEQIDRASAANIRRSKEELLADDEEEDFFGYTLTLFCSCDFTKCHPVDDTLGD